MSPWLRTQWRRIMKVIMTHNYWLWGTLISIIISVKKHQIIYKSGHSYLCTCMGNKYLACRSEFVWNVYIQVMSKEISFSILNMLARACSGIVARGKCLEIPRLTVKRTLSLTKWIENLSRYYGFQIQVKTSRTGHRWRETKDFFVFCSEKIHLVSIVFLMF